MVAVGVIAFVISLFLILLIIYFVLEFKKRRLLKIFPKKTPTTLQWISTDSPIPGIKEASLTVKTNGIISLAFAPFQEYFEVILEGETYPSPVNIYKKVSPGVITLYVKSFHSLPPPPTFSTTHITHVKGIEDSPGDLGFYKNVRDLFQSTFSTPPLRSLVSTSSEITKTIHQETLELSLSPGEKATVFIPTREDTLGCQGLLFVNGVEVNEKYSIITNYEFTESVIITQLIGGVSTNSILPFYAYVFEE